MYSLQKSTHPTGYLTVPISLEVPHRGVGEYSGQTLGGNSLTIPDEAKSACKTSRPTTCQVDNDILSTTVPQDWKGEERLPIQRPTQQEGANCDSLIEKFTSSDQITFLINDNGICSGISTKGLFIHCWIGI